MDLLTFRLEVLRKQLQRGRSVNFALNPHLSVCDPSLAHSLVYYWGPLIYKLIVETLRKSGLRISPINIWNQGMLLSLPTNSVEKGVEACQLLIDLFNQSKSLKGFIKEDYAATFSGGIQFDSTNMIFISDDGSLEHVVMQFAEALPPRLAEVLERRLVSFLMTPNCGAKSLVAAKREAQKFLQEQWPEMVNTAFAEALETEREEDMVLNDDVPGRLIHPGSEMSLRSICLNVLMKVTSLDPSFTTMEEEEKSILLEKLNLEDEEHLVRSRPYTACLPLILPNMECGKCGFLDHLDVTQIHPEEPLLKCA